MKAQPRSSITSRGGHSANNCGGNAVGDPDHEHSDYGDDVFDGFESEDLSPSRRSSNYGGEFENEEEPPHIAENHALAFASAPTQDDVGLQIAPDRGGEEREEPERYRKKRDVDEKRSALLVGASDDEKRRRHDASSLATRVRPCTDEERAIGRTQVQEPYMLLQVPTDGDADRDGDDVHVGNLDEHLHPGFVSAGHMKFPPADVLGRGDRERRRPIKSDAEMLSPGPFVAPGAELYPQVDYYPGNGPWPQQQPLPRQLNNLQSRTEGRQKQQIARRARSHSFKRRAQVQERDGQTRPQGGSPNGEDAGATANIRRERQERLIQQLTRDNGVLQRKVAGYQLALQLSADEDDFSTSPSFSAAMKLQQAAPPAFPRDGGTPAPSPRVARSWTHQNQPQMSRSSTIERNLSYTTLVRQFDRGRRRARTVERANEVLGARVNELESGAVLRATQSKLVQREEEIVALREELSVLKRLARAQDRKFEGSQAHALARRLWLAEEELRIARSTISSLGAEVYGLRQFRRHQDQNRHRHSVTGAAGSTPDVPSNTGPRQPSPRRPLRRRRLSHQNSEVVDARRKRHEREQPRSRSPTTTGLDRSLETNGSLSGGGKLVASSEGTTDGVGGEHQAARKQMSEAKTLQRALANMRSKAQGERRAAQVEIDGLKEDKAVLGQALGVKAKEIRMQLLQVNHLKREVRDLSAGAMKLEEASRVVPSASLACRKRGVVSAATTGGETLASAATKMGQRRAKSAAIVGRYAIPAAKGPGRGSLVSSAGPPRLLRARPDYPNWERDTEGERADPNGVFTPMGWNRDWDERGTTAASVADTDTPRMAVRVQSGADAATMTRGDRGGGFEQGPLGVQIETTGVGGGGGDESRDEKMDKGKGKESIVAAETRETQIEAAAAASAGLANSRKHSRPCPLAGILDMSEPPLRGHRRSYYNEGDGQVYLVPPSNEERTVAGLSEATREEDRYKCVIDFQGIVRHGEDCSLRDVAHTIAIPRNKRQSLSARKKSPVDNSDCNALDGGSDPDPLPISIGIPIRMWHRDGSSDWDPTGAGTAERLSIVSRRSSARNSCVSISEEGRLSATLSVSRRPTYFSVETVPESDA